MNIPVLNGSPRQNGNTAKMVTAFCEGAESSNHTIATCQELLNQAAELSETATAQLEKATADLSSQAGKLNEEYGSKLKELNEYKHRLRSKAVKWIVISQSVLIALSAALQLWLR